MDIGITGSSDPETQKTIDKINNRKIRLKTEAWKVIKQIVPIMTEKMANISTEDIGEII